MSAPHERETHEEFLTRRVTELDAYIDNLRARIAELEAERAWRPIAEAPKSTSEPTAHGFDVRGAYFLAYCPDESASDPLGCICVCWWEPHLDGGRWQGEAGFALRPTHFMPLPLPPAPEGE